MRAEGHVYPVYIGDGIVSEFPAFLRRHRPPSSGDRSIILITDQYLRNSIALSIAAGLRRMGWQVRLKSLPRGEKAKSFDSLQEIYGFLLKSQAERRTPLVAVGGGAVGDVAGFAAATYCRGIPLVHVPTTLTAQIDSAIGGKTAINHSSAKNAVGTFHQPLFVFSDVGFLKRLPEREFLSGMAEAVKCGLVSGGVFAGWLVHAWDDVLRRNPAALLRLVRACAQWKARVVADDLRDETGRREVLNFGHTLGHALEASSHYRWFSHGEAVAWGMRAAVALSEERGWIPPGERRLAGVLLQKLPAPFPPKGLRWRDILAALRRDKKIRDGRNTFVLLRRVGKPVRIHDVGPIDLKRVTERIGLSLR